MMDSTATAIFWMGVGVLLTAAISLGSSIVATKAYRRLAVVLSVFILLAALAITLALSSDGEFVNGLLNERPMWSPDSGDLHTYFETPSIGATRSYAYSLVYAQTGDAETPNAPGSRALSGTYSETVRIVNGAWAEQGITVVGVETAGKNHLPPCPDNFHWYVYDQSRFYVVCSTRHVSGAANEFASNSEPTLVAYGAFTSDTITLEPEYVAPFDIGAEWRSSGAYAVVRDKVTKTTPIGTLNNCYQIEYQAIHYREWRYLCPGIGLAAVEVEDHGDHYSAQLVSGR